jgi:hypothetical protein
MVDTLRAKGAADEDIVKAFKSIPGVDKSFFRDIGLEAAVVEQEQKNTVAAINNEKLIEIARANGFQGSPEYLAAEGMKISAADEEVERGAKRAQLAATSATLSKEQQEVEMRAGKEQAFAGIRARVGGSVNAFMQGITSVGVGAMNRPEYEARIQSQVIPLLNQNLPALEQQVTQQFMAVSGVTADEVKSNVDLVMRPIRGAVEGMQKNATRFTTMAEQLRAQHGLEFARTLPTIAFLENAFGRDINTRFMELSKDKIDALITEQANTDWSNPNAQSILMIKAGMILKGEMSMQGQPTEVIQNAIAATRDLSEQIVKDINLVQPETVNMAATGIGQLGLAANNLSPAEGEQAHFNIARNLGRQSTWQAIEAMIANPRYRETGERVVQVARSGSVIGLKSIETLAKTKMPAGWEMKYNKASGRYEVSGTRGTKPGGGTRLSGGANARFGVPDFSTGAPQTAQAFADSANRYLSLLVATEKHSLEPIKGSAKQIREYHALGLVPEGAQKTKSAAKTADEQTDAMINKLTETIQRLPQQLSSQSELVAGLTSDAPTVVRKILGAEGGAGGLKNPDSSATGAGQFINSTWLATVRKHRPDLAKGKSDSEILALRKDDDVAVEMTTRLTEDNQAALQSRGIPSTDRNTYLAHFLGTGGAIPVLSSDPSTPITQVVSSAAIAANRAVFKSIKTVGDLLSWAERKMS